MRHLTGANHIRIMYQVLKCHKNTKKKTDLWAAFERHYLSLTVLIIHAFLLRLPSLFPLPVMDY